MKYGIVEEIVKKEDKDKLSYYHDEIERIKNRIAKDRDKLRDLISEAEDVLEDVNGFLELQDDALDILSQML